MDLISMGISLAFFALTWLLARLCEKLGNRPAGEKS